jgi:endonuclease/exonuclease/phosphatase family metal-dependent hydrolase
VRVPLLRSLVLCVCGFQTLAVAQPVEIRVATFNLEDVRTSDLRDPAQPRLKALAEIIQRIAPNVLFLNEIAYDGPGSPGYVEGSEPGQNARLFAENFLSVAQAPGLTPLHMKAFMAPSNTGMPSGIDLDRSGAVASAFPPPATAGPDGSVGRLSRREDRDVARAYGGDCWGYGEFPGHYAMALLVSEPLEIQREGVRTFRLLPWDFMPGATWPPADGSGEGTWYPEEAREKVRLSSKSHWDVPVKLPNGSVVHVLCSHPTPPAFDGEEKRNARRNHDEIRFWADYLDGDGWIVDDANHPGGLDEYAHFVIVGDMNADPDEGSAWKNPMGELILRHKRVRATSPVSDVEVERLDPDDTAHFGLRVDYVLPSKTMEVIGTGVWREGPSGGSWAGRFPSDHFPVWADLSVPEP